MPCLLFFGGPTLSAFRMFLPSFVLNGVSVVSAVVALANAPDRQTSFAAIATAVSTSIISVLTATLPVLKLLRDEQLARAETERIKLRDELFGLRSFVRGLVQGSPDAILEKDLNGTIRSWSRGAEVLFGWAAREVVGRNVRELTPDDKWAEEYSIVDRLREGVLISNLRTARIAKDGRRLDVVLTITPVRDTLDRVAGAVSVIRPDDGGVAPASPPSGNAPTAEAGEPPCGAPPLRPPG